MTKTNGAPRGPARTKILPVRFTEAEAADLERIAGVLQIPSRPGSHDTGSAGLIRRALIFYFTYHPEYLSIFAGNGEPRG